MQLLRKIGWGLLAVLGISVLTAGIFWNSMQPDYEGDVKLSSLFHETKVYYDAYGIPHIYALNEKDAFRVLGYVHAQDRLWQMELLRRVARGGLSELFGKDLISTDKFFLSLGIDDASAKTVSGLDTNSPMVILSQAYLDGINQFIEEGQTPIEFMLTGAEKKPFSLVDVYNSIGYMAFSFAMAHKTDPLLTNIKDKLGAAYLKDLEIGSNPDTDWIKNYNRAWSDSILNNLTSAVTNALKGLSLPLFEGSNSWVIAPEKTKNGKVLFANDPHIGFAQPSVWYEAHINTPSYEKYGYHLAGIPFPLLGHNYDVAYGLTMFENDDIDFYYEQTNPSNISEYKTENGWEAYGKVSKTIKVKDNKDSVFTFNRTRNGPVLNGIADQITGERPISMSWIYTQLDNRVMDALFGIAHATNLEEFKSALPKIHAPGLNVMYGDSKGNVAWFATAKLYKMPDSVSTKFILDGTSNTEKPIKYLDFSENPQAVNPPWGYVYSANNQPDSISGILYPGYYLPENRAKRIEQLLEPRNNWDREGVEKMITDVTSSVNPSIIANFIKIMDVKKVDSLQIHALDKLKGWKGDYPLESVEGTIFHRWEYFFLKNTFEDELGKDMFPQFLATHFSKRLVAPMSGKAESVWWDNSNTKDVVETQKDIVNTSFDQAITSLVLDFGNDMKDWSWSRVHTLEHEHPIGSVAALRSFLNVGPFPVNGTREVINNMSFSYGDNGIYKVGSGPSTRRVIDFSDVENSTGIIPTGQSGNPFSPHYKDQAEMYLKGEFRKMLLNKDEIKDGSKSVLIFKSSDVSN